MSPGIHLVIFPETMSKAGELVLNWCQEVPVKMPPLGVRGAFGSMLAFVVWERKCSRGTIILTLRRGCGNTQSLLRDLSEYTCLFTMMNDWPRSELKSFFFWRWYKNPAQRFSQRPEKHFQRHEVQYKCYELSSWVRWTVATWIWCRSFQDFGMEKQVPINT